MKFRKAAALLLVLVVFAALPLSAGAKTWETEDFTAEVPDDLYQFSLDTPVGDPAWALAGIAEPAQKLEEYTKMNAIANFVSKDGKLSILAMKKESDYSKQIYNFGEATAEEQQEVLEKLSSTDSDKFQVDRSIYEGGELPFFRIKIDGEVDDGTTHHELIYGTMVNGAAYTFDIYGGQEDIPQDHIAILEEILNTVHFTNVLPKSDNTLTQEDLVKTVGLLVLLLAVIVTPFIYFPLKSKADKRKKAKLAQQLEEYRKTHGNDDTLSGNMRFANSTDCTREAIKSFSIFHAYIKNIGSLIIGAVLSLVTVIITFTLDSEWWMKLLAVGIVVYYGYKIFSTPTNIEKVQRKVYDRGTSSTAIYAFYDEAFRVSGVQSASVYPYFQITDVRKHGHYVYLYYGPDNAYMVDQFGFKLGEYEDFLKFISEKTGKKL